MPNFWKIANSILLSIQFIICTLGTFYKHLAFGRGLGDMYWYGLMYLLFIVHLILTINSGNKSLERFKIITVIYTITTLFICLQATIYRGPEYPWKGEIFYEN